MFGKLAEQRLELLRGQRNPFPILGLALPILEAEERSAHVPNLNQPLVDVVRRGNILCVAEEDRGLLDPVLPRNCGAGRSPDCVWSEALVEIRRRRHIAPDLLDLPLPERRPRPGYEEIVPLCALRGGYEAMERFRAYTDNRSLSSRLLTLRTLLPDDPDARNLDHCGVEGNLGVVAVEGHVASVNCERFGDPQPARPQYVEEIHKVATRARAALALDRCGAERIQLLERREALALAAGRLRVPYAPNACAHWVLADRPLAQRPLERLPQDGSDCLDLTGRRRPEEVQDTLYADRINAADRIATEHARGAFERDHCSLARPTRALGDVCSGDLRIPVECLWRQDSGCPFTREPPGDEIRNCRGWGDGCRLGYDARVVLSDLGEKRALGERLGASVRFDEPSRVAIRRAVASLSAPTVASRPVVPVEEHATVLSRRSRGSWCHRSLSNGFPMHQTLPSGTDHDVPDGRGLRPGTSKPPPVGEETVTEPQALLYVDASILALPGMTDSWIERFNDLTDHVAENRYALEVTVLLPPRVSRTVRIRALAVRADTLGTSSATAHSRVAALTLDAGPRRPRHVAQVWWLTLDPGAQRPLLERAGSLPLRILPARDGIEPPLVEDVEEVLIGWQPPESVAVEPPVDAVYVREHALPADLREFISFSHEASLHGVVLIVQMPASDEARTVLRDAGIRMGFPLHPPSNIRRLVWISRVAGREVVQDERLAPFADEVIPVRPPRDVAGWSALLGRLTRA